MTSSISLPRMISHWIPLNNTKHPLGYSLLTSMRTKIFYSPSKCLLSLLVRFSFNLVYNQNKEKAPSNLDKISSCSSIKTRKSKTPSTTITSRAISTTSVILRIPTQQIIHLCSQLIHFKSNSFSYSPVISKKIASKVQIYSIHHKKNMAQNH